MAKWVHGGTTLRCALIVVLLALTLAALGSYMIALLIGIHLLLFVEEGVRISQQYLLGLPLYLFLWQSATIPGSWNVGAVYVTLTIIYATCFVAAWIGPRARFHKVVRGAFAQPLRALQRNFLAVMPIISAIALFLVLLTTVLQEAVGVETGDISFKDPYVGLFSLAYSPVVEEVGFRLVPLGLTAALSTIFAGLERGMGWVGLAKLIPLAFLHPSEAKSRLGIEGFSKVEWLILVFSSLTFGIGHVILGQGWKAGKATSASISGMILGLVYLRYGAFAPILVHWFFNYYLQVGSYFFPAYGYVSWFMHLLLVPVGFFLWLAEGAKWPSVAGRIRKSNEPKQNPAEKSG